MEKQQKMMREMRKTIDCWSNLIMCLLVIGVEPDGDCGLRRGGCDEVSRWSCDGVKMEISRRIGKPSKVQYNEPDPAR